MAGTRDEPAGESRWFPVHLTPAMLERVSGPDLAIPLLGSAVDVAIVERAAALFPPLGSASGWGARFGRELNATDDRETFREREGGRLRPGQLPIVEGKHLEPFRVAVSAGRHSVGSREAARLLPDGRYRKMRLAYRDVADLPTAPDLAVIATPAEGVPQIVRSLGARGCRAAVIVSSGFDAKCDGGSLRDLLLAAGPAD